MARVLGLTGNIASGKTTVGRFLLELGAERYIDADALVHRLYLAGQPVVEQIVEVFSPKVLGADGNINRIALGEKVFRDPAALRQLEGIVHPAVHTLMLQELQQVRPGGIAILDAVKLLEGGSAAFCQQVWLVVSSPELQLQRLMARNGITAEQAHARLRSQPDNNARRALVDEIIENDGSLDEMHRQVHVAFQRFCLRFPAHS